MIYQRSLQTSIILELVKISDYAIDPAMREGNFSEHNPGIKKIILCLHKDERGREASQALLRSLSGYEVLDSPPPKGKDYNDYLQIQRGISSRV